MVQLFPARLPPLSPRRELTGTFSQASELKYTANTQTAQLHARYTGQSVWPKVLSEQRPRAAGH